MPSRSLTVDVKAAVIKWARESSAWTIEEIAEKLRVSATKYHEWESTGHAIPLSQLQSLSKYYKRSLAVFFLPAPPSEPKPPKDFRLLPGRTGKFERKTLLAIRRALWLQSAAGDLLDSLDLPKLANIGTTSLEDDPELISRRIRHVFGITISDQFQWSSESEALRKWRDAIETVGLLVFSQSMSVTDARGFSLSNIKPWVIVVNSSDAVRARIFTLFHEFGHLLLHIPGVCIPRADYSRSVKQNKVELWCNKFAAALLLPREFVEDQVSKHAGTDGLAIMLGEISRRCKVSQEAVLRRLTSLDLISEKQFGEQLERLKVQVKAKRKSGPVSPAVRSVSGRGRQFTRLVLEGKEKGILTYKDVSDLLSIRLKHLEKVSSLVTA
jgi:Zn-dependent peptidase ImmA (M78 family)/transcriptional regulator with XRE-family HTH domain